ncbi:MAG: InlB B-repeat-containing protein, partial [Bacilli bacterium]|nr:InlB B-repeat-containing protein [Bacilli bacterium]
MERIKELRMTAIILLVGVFLLSGCFFSSKNEVTFKTNGGSEVKSASVKSGNKLEVPDVPTKEGYVFEGWYLNGKEYNFEDEVNEDITLVAKWRKVEVDDEEGNDEDDDNEKEEEPTTSATTKKVTKKTTTASGTVKKTTTKKTTTGQTETTTKKTTSSTTTKVPEEKPTEPIIPEKPSVPEEPNIPEEPTVPEVPEKKELKMNITITEENLDTMIVESKNDNVLDVIKSDGDVKVENPEEIKKKYNLVIDLNSEEVNTISNLSEEDLNSLLSSDVTKWKINDQKGKFLELDIKDDKISTSSDEAIEVIVLN